MANPLVLMLLKTNIYATSSQFQNDRGSWPGITYLWGTKDDQTAHGFTGYALIALDIEDQVNNVNVLQYLRETAGAKATNPVDAAGAFASGSGGVMVKEELLDFIQQLRRTLNMP